MLKIKSKSAIVHEINHDALKQHAQMLLQRSQQMIKQKIQKIHNKQAKIEAIEKNFIQWAGQKQTFIKQKLEKSIKNKEDHLQKIVKKCKDHEKYIGQKLKTYQSRKRQTLRQAWKKAEQYKHSIQLYRNSKNMSFERNIQKNYSQSNNQMTRSVYVGQKDAGFNKNENQKEYLTINYGTNNNLSKNYNNNASKQYWNEINKSFHQLRVPESMHVKTEQQKEDEINKNKMNEKLKQTLARFKHNTQKEQENKIQQLGEKLDKIQKTRLKKLEMFKKKGDSPSRINKYDEEGQEGQKKKEKKLQKKGYRIHSESIMKQKRLHDWSQLNRQKREQFQQTFMQNSNQYLQHQKIKYMKTALAKQIAQSTIQKKLFYERLKH